MVYIKVCHRKCFKILDIVICLMCSNSNCIAVKRIKNKSSKLYTHYNHNQGSYNITKHFYYLTHAKTIPLFTSSHYTLYCTLSHITCITCITHVTHSHTNHTLSHTSHTLTHITHLSHSASPFCCTNTDTTSVL